MVNIRITQITPIPTTPGSPRKYDLVLDGKGKGKGHHIAYEKNEKVEWEVLGTSPVKKILDIKWKPISGSTDIFGTNPDNKPTRISDKKWKAKLNNITDDAIYVYSIKFEIDGDSTPYEADPIISIKPSTTFNIILNIISFLLSGLFGFFTLKFLTRKTQHNLQP